MTEVKKTLNQLLVVQLKEKLATLSSQIAQAENQGQTTTVANLEQEYNQTLAKLSPLQSTKT